MLLPTFILWILAQDVICANVQLLKRHQPATFACNTGTYDRVLLKRVTLLSKYIFTGKVFGASVGSNGTRVYKVNIRRVLKGDLNEIGVVVKFGTAKSLRFSDATVFVESFRAFGCRPLRMRTYGIFLTERKHAESHIKLSLVVEPLVLTLRSLEIIEAAVKVLELTSTSISDTVEIMLKKIGFNIFVLIFLQWFYSPSLCRTKLLIDHDGGADDAMAIFISLLYEKYFDGPEVVALTLTHGNVNEDQVYVNSQRILNKADRRDVPIYRGSPRALVKSVESDFFFGVDGLGDSEIEHFEQIQTQKNNAAFALIELSKKYKDELVVMAIGSLTNIALAKSMDSEFIGRLKHLYVGAGNIHTNKSIEVEFNARVDVEAYSIVVDNVTSDKVTIIPLSQIRASLNFSKEWRKDVLGTIPTRIMMAQNSYERLSFAASKRWHLLDPAVAAIVLDDAVVQEYKYSYNSICLCGDQRGLNTNDFESKKPNVRVVYSGNEEYYKKFLIDIFSAELKIEKT